jgi:hypothetical protein
MAAEIPIPERSASASPATGGGEDEVAAQLQRVYEYVLQGRRPEAVGATERLAEELAVDIERPE